MARTDSGHLKHGISPAIPEAGQVPHTQLRAKRTIETDVCVVGAGLVGLVHALEARRRGLSVVVLESGLHPEGGSIRGHGQLFFSALPAGRSQLEAQAARQRWLELAARAGMFVEDAGTLVVAGSGAELALLETAAADPDRGARLLGPREVRTLVSIPTGGLLGALHGTQDLRIDPRAAPAQLARLLTRDPRARIEWNTSVQEVEPGLVRAGPLRVRAEAVVVCPGAARAPVPLNTRSVSSRVHLVRLQMLRLTGTKGRRYRPALTTTAAVLEHPGFAELAGAEELRVRVELARPELVERGLRLLVVQLPDGDLIVGGVDSGATPSPFSSERLDSLLLQEAETLLGITPRVSQRWSVWEARLRDRDACGLLVGTPMPGVRLVQSVGALGPALCPTRAVEVLDDLMLVPALDAGPISARDQRVRERSDEGLRAHSAAFGRRPTPLNARAVPPEQEIGA